MSSIETKIRHMSSEGKSIKGENVSFDNILSYFPLPSPFTHVKEDLSKVKPYQHGKLEISLQGQLLNSFVSYTKFSRDLIESYDYMIDSFIERVRREKIKIDHNGNIYVISFDMRIDKPLLTVSSDTGEGSKDIPMTPLQARQQKLTYGGNVNLTLKLSKNGDDKYNDPKEINMGEIPVMIGSYLDNLSRKSDYDLLNMGECPHDVSGYFIIKGMEYVILMSDKVRSNKFMAYAKKKYYISSLSSSTFDKKSSMIEIFKDPKTMTYRVWFSIMGSIEDQTEYGHSLNIFTIFKMISEHLTVDDMLQILRDTAGSVDKDGIINSSYKRKMNIEISPTLGEYQTLADDDIWKVFSIFDSTIKKPDDTENVSRRYRKKKQVKREYERSVSLEYRRKFMKYFFSNSVDIDEYGQVKDDQSDQTIREKLYSFGSLVNRLIGVNIKSRLEDNRDSWGNKEVKNAGILMGEKLDTIWNDMIKNIKEFDYSILSNITTDNIPIKKEKITDIFQKSFTSNWNQGHSDKVNKITETLSRTSILSSYAYITRISSPSQKNDKTKKKREVQQSQWGYVCYVDTPEGQNVSILKAKAVSCLISIVRDIDLLIYSKETKRLFTFDKQKRYGTSLFVYNGKVLGFVNAKMMFSYLKEKKDKKVIPFDVFIMFVPEDNTLYLYSNEGRLVRPVLTINKHENDKYTPFKQTINFYEAVRSNMLSKEQIQNFKLLEDMKLVTYIDAWEQEAGALVAQSRNMLESMTNDINSTLSLINKAEQLKSQSEKLYMSINSKHIEGSIVKTPIYVDKKLYQKEIDDKILDLENKKKKMVSDMVEFKKVLVTQMNDMKDYLKKENELKRIASALGILEKDVATYSVENRKKYNFVKDILDSRSLEYVATFNELNKNYAKKYKVFQEQLKNIEKEIADSNNMINKDPITDDDVDNYIESLKNALEYLSKKEKFDYCELDPNVVYGVSASIVPLPDHNQGPRNSFECNMGRQAVGVYNSNHMYRYDSAVQKVLAFPSIPTFKTQIYEQLGMNRLGSGESIILAMLTNMNLQEEDAVLVSQRAVDSGFGLITYYNTVSSQITKDQSGVTEEFTRYIPQKIIRVGDKNPYRHLDENGIARVGSTLEIGDCVIGKIRRYLDDTESQETKDASSYIKKGQEGTVLSVIRDGNTIIVKTYGVYNQIVGNKLATRHAQKGTIGTIYPPDRMMKFLDGSTPDIIMNTHAIPSRMTLGQLIEMLVGKSSLLSGEYVDATAYNDFDINDFIRTLKSHGHNEWGWEVMVNGLTGEKFKALVFSGPVFYQILKHQVKDKNQVRAKGAKSEITGQPVAGKARGGGLRFGYQEKDAILSHGAMKLINEVFSESSDKKPCMVCETCNNIAYIDINGAYQCRSCVGETKPVMVNLPNSQHITSNLLTAAGVYTKIIPSKQ